jgi:hypothetical protein
MGQDPVLGSVPWEACHTLTPTAPARAAPVPVTQWSSLHLEAPCIPCARDTT